MGAYLSKPICDKESEDKEGDVLSYGASAMQGWRLSQEVRSETCLFFCYVNDTLPKQKYSHVSSSYKTKMRHSTRMSLYKYAQKSKVVLQTGVVWVDINTSGFSGTRPKIGYLFGFFTLQRCDPAEVGPYFLYMTSSIHTVSLHKFICTKMAHASWSTLVWDNFGTLFQSVHSILVRIILVSVVPDCGYASGESGQISNEIWQMPVQPK